MTDQPAIVIERAYAASPEELWSLWTTREGFESWWGPAGFRVEVHAMEARVGGRLHYDMIADSPEMVAAMREMGSPVSHETRGHFAEFEPHRRLKLVHLIDFLPGVAPYDSVIIVEVLPAGDRTRMVVSLFGMHDEAHTGMQIEGFTSQLTKLDGRYA